GAPAFAQANTKALFARHPISALKITGGTQGADGWKDIAKADWLPQLRELELNNVSLAPGGAKSLLTSAGLANLNTLKLVRITSAQELGRTLGACPSFSR